VTTAVLIATAASDDGGAAAAQPWEDGTLLRRVLEQLATLGVRTAHVITRPEWEDALLPSLDGLPLRAELLTSGSLGEDLRTVAGVARDLGGDDGDLLVAYADMVTHREALAGLLADPRVPTGILVADAADGHALAWPVRDSRGRVVSAGSAFHAVNKPNFRFLGALRVASPNREMVVDVAERLATLADSPPEAWQREREHKAAAPDDAVALLVVGLVRSGVHLNQSPLRRLFWGRPLSAAAVMSAREQIAACDEQKVLLDSAVKPMDGFFTTFFVSPYSKYIARWAARRGFTPNQVTTVSMLIGIAAAAAFATGARAGLITGAVLLQIAFTTDCVDGQLARYTRTFSKLGAWLDSIFDRGKEYVVFAGLAIGASRHGDPVWALAGAALTLQTVRHSFDFSFGAAQHQTIGAAEHRPLEDPWDGTGAVEQDSAPQVEDEPELLPGTRVRSRSVPARILSSWRRLDSAPGLLWIKRILVLPIGERFAAISITAALFSARTTFTVLLAWGTFALVYSLAGRLLRSLR
jgi:phosphatidylglycerophosphate synthase